MTTTPQNYTVQEKLSMLRKQYADIQQKKKDYHHVRRQRAMSGSISQTQLWLYNDGMDRLNTIKQLHEEKMKEQFWDHSSCASSFAESRSVTSSNRCERLYRLGVAKIQEQRERDHSSCVSSYAESQTVTSSDRYDLLHRLVVKKIRQKRENTKDIDKTLEKADDEAVEVVLASKHTYCSISNSEDVINEGASSFAESRNDVSVRSSDRFERLYRLGVERIRERSERDQL